MKVAASLQIYMGRCPKVVCSHQSLATHPCFQTFWGISLSRIVIQSVALHLYGTAVSIT